VRLRRPANRTDGTTPSQGSDDHTRGKYVAVKSAAGGIPATGDPVKADVRKKRGRLLLVFVSASVSRAASWIFHV
jgi:hypothetical protein